MQCAMLCYNRTLGYTLQCICGRNGTDKNERKVLLFLKNFLIFCHFLDFDDNFSVVFFPFVEIPHSGIHLTRFLVVLVPLVLLTIQRI